MMLTKVRVSKITEQLLRDVFKRHFELQNALKLVATEKYSKIDLRDVVRYNIDCINLIYHPLLLKERSFFESMETIQDFKTLVLQIEEVLEHELTKPINNDSVFFTSEDIKKTIAILRKLQIRLNNKKRN